MEATLTKTNRSMGQIKNQNQADEKYDYLKSPHLDTKRKLVREAFSAKDGSEVQVISARELSESKLIGWINSYKALLKYVSKDYRHIFEPKTTGSRSGTRYYVSPENVVKFLVMFEDNKL